eukprot:gene10875-12032_t
MASLDIRLKKVNKVYREGEKIRGLVVVDSKNDVVHTGITLFVEGSVNMQLSAKSVGLFEAFYNSVKPITLMNANYEIAKGGKIPGGKTEIPFELPLKPHGNRNLFETYHGVFINVQYTLKCEMRRPLLNKDLVKTSEFLVEVKTPKIEPARPIDFHITPDSLHGVKESQKSKVPPFSVKGRLDTAVCSILEPITGSVALKDMQKMIADGDVCRGCSIPIYMIFPRLFTCPTLATTNFKIEFELNLVIIFVDDHLVTENFPIRIYRP